MKNGNVIKAGDRSADGRTRATVMGAGPLLVYVAGLDGSGELLFKQAPALSRSFRVATFRLRERGRFTYDDLAGDVAEIIMRLGEQKAIIIGESFGGTVALWFAIHHPEMVEQLVIVNSFPRFRARLRIKLAAAVTSSLPFKLVWPFRRLSSFIGLSLDKVSREDRKRCYRIFNGVAGEGYARRLRLIEEFDCEERLCEIKAPTLFIAAEDDRLIPSAREARLMASRIPNAAVRIIPGVGHACLLGDRVRLADIIGGRGSVVSGQ
jgi:pimeloyl-ACP methyl ester carboxylesterase